MFSNQHDVDTSKQQFSLLQNVTKYLLLKKSDKISPLFLQVCPMCSAEVSTSGNKEPWLLSDGHLGHLMGITSGITAASVLSKQKQNLLHTCKEIRKYFSCQSKVLSWFSAHWIYWPCRLWSQFPSDALWLLYDP